MTQAILVGGAGTRLRPLTDTPEADDAAGRPFLRGAPARPPRRHRVTDDLLCGRVLDALRAHFGEGESAGVRLRYVVDLEPLGTAERHEERRGAARRLPVPGPGTATSLTDLDLSAVDMEAHARTGAAGTVVLTPVEDLSAFGLVRLYDDHPSRRCRRSPRPGELRPGEPFRINAGTYLLDPSCSTTSRRAGRSRSSARSSSPAGGRRPVRLPERRLLARHRHARPPTWRRTTTC